MKNLLKSGTFWTVVFGLISIVLAFILYDWANKKREPVYAVKKAPTLIFDKNNASPRIKLLQNDSVIIDQNVYVTNLVFWNSGDLPIKQENVRKSFQIGVSKDAKILDYKIVAETHSEISQFYLTPRTETLLIDWEYFDPDFGVEFQITYSGSEESEVFIDGYVLGKEVSKVAALTIEPWYISSVHRIFFIFFIILLLGTFFAKKTGENMIIFYFLLVIYALAAVIMFYPYFINYSLPI